MKEKAKPDLSPAQLRKLGTMFLMRRFPKQVQSDVLSDGQVAKSAGLIITHPIKLAEGHTFERKLIFGALRKLADKRKVPTSLPSVSRARVKVRLSAKGNDGFIRIGKADIRVPNAMLLTSSIGRRKSTLATCLRKHTLDLEQLDKLERLVAKRTLSDDDFVAIGGILAASPESFADALRERAKTGRLDKADFLPDATVYWSNLVASRKTSETLPDYLANELAIRQKALLLADPVAGLDIVSLSFGAPELVPLATLKQVEADDLVRAIEHLFEIGDPFAIAGAFAICAEWVQSDPRFAALGDKALECLFKDPERLLLQFATYGAAFVIATAYLSEHEVFQREAVFWRRVAAATHAAVVARTLGPASDQGEPMLTWAMRLSGRSFYLSVLNDAAIEPRWRPDWIDAPFLAADTFGRLTGSIAAIAAAVPKSWSAAIAKAKKWIEQLRVQLAAGYPSILQGANPLLVADASVGSQLYDELEQTPTLENFVYLTPLVSALGFQARGRPAAVTVLHQLRTETGPVGPEVAERALSLAALIAVQTCDKELAEMAAQIAIERVGAGVAAESLMAMVAILVESGAATPDREQAATVLADRLENLTFVAPQEALNELLVLLNTLRRINPKLATRLGPAFATARLGRALAA